jgi:tripartite ATP-independent transporter DctM subunit
MIRKLVYATALVLAAALAVLPLLFKLLTAIGLAAIPSSDRMLVHLVFMFSCIAGVITSAKNKQLSLGVVHEALSPRIQPIVLPIQKCITTTVLTALFLASFSEIFMAFLPGDTLWGIPLQLIFAFIPVMYLGMLLLAVTRERMIIASVTGIGIGFFIATGPVFGILYSLFGLEDAPLLTAILAIWEQAASVLLWPLVLLLIASAIFGTPIFIALSGITYVAFSQGGGYVEMIPLESYGILTDKSIAAIPLFTLAGYLLAGGSAGKRLLDVVKNSVGWIRGGPVIAAVLVATFFTTFTGASGVTILALGGLLTVILTGSGYSKSDAESLITSSGSIGMLFPPSLAIIIYGTTNIFSVNMFDLFKGALIPGVLMALAMILVAILRDRSVHRDPFSVKELTVSLMNGAGEILLPVLIVAGFFSGALSLMETAAFAAVYAFVLEVFIRKDYSLKEGVKVILKSIPVAGGILVIIASAKGLAYFLIDAGIPMLLTDLVMTFVESKYVFLLLLNILLIIVGCLMDLYSAILVVSPLIIPVAESFGIHPVHTGVIFLTNLSLGFLTPPVGMNLFIASYTFNRPVMQIARSILPYLLIQFVILMLVTYVPVFSTILL